jgi:hypothetical protein
MSFTYRLNSTGETVHPGINQPACYDVYIWLTEDVWNVRQ